jgi:hypothetical protein
VKFLFLSAQDVKGRTENFHFLGHISRRGTANQSHVPHWRKEVNVMEAVLSEITVGAGVFLSAVALLVLVIGGVLLGRLSEEEKSGRRFFWAEWPLPEAEPRVPSEREALRAA